MKHHDADVNVCTTLGHRYTSSTITYCPHTGAHLVRTNVWEDTGDDEPKMIHTSTFEAGPFDTFEDVTRESVARLEMALEILKAMEAR